MLMNFRGKWEIFHGPFKKLLREDPHKLLKLILFALSLLLSIDLDLRRWLFVHQDAFESRPMNEFLRLLKFRVTADFDG